MLKLTIMYCHELLNMNDNGYYSHFNIHPKTTHKYGKNKRILKVIVRELKDDESSIYWAWWNNEHNEFRHCYHLKKILGMVFPYGIEAEEERGRGLAVNVMIEVVGEVKI